MAKTSPQRPFKGEAVGFANQVLVGSDRAHHKTTKLLLAAASSSRGGQKRDKYVRVVEVTPSLPGTLVVPRNLSVVVVVVVPRQGP